MPKAVLLFFAKAFILLSPAIFLLCAYFVLDPFKVLRTYDSYYISGIPSYVTLNNDFVATETFKKYYASNQYDSFIFGSSRSRFYEVADWQKYIRSTRCFHYDSSAESLYGIHAKLRYLDRSGIKINNALIILDSGLLSDVQNSESHFVRKHPDLSGESSVKFQLRFLKTFLNPRFVVAYLHFSATKKFYPYMAKESLLNNTPMEYELFSNELKFNRIEAKISSNPAAFYDERKKSFYARGVEQSFSPPVIGEVQKKMLSEMRDILFRHQCKFKILISPLYDQKKIDLKDLSYLQGMFGPGRVYDFSGINNFTQSYTNYYDSSHYRPHVAREIMAIIYNKQN